MSLSLLNQIACGRTDCVHELIASGADLNVGDGNGVTALQHCAYYGDVSAIRLLLAHGVPLGQLGTDALRAAAFHGHWQLCQFLLEQGASVNAADPDTGETALHLALCSDDRWRYDAVIRVLLSAGADVTVRTLPDKPLGSFMRDCRSKAETPLHRAAACGSVETIQLLLDAGAARDNKDQHGDSPLSWASWQRRPAEILRLLCYDGFPIHPAYQPLRRNLIGKPMV